MIILEKNLNIFVIISIIFLQFLKIEAETEEKCKIIENSELRKILRHFSNIENLVKNLQTNNEIYHKNFNEIKNKLEDLGNNSFNGINGIVDDLKSKNEILKEKFNDIIGTMRDLKQNLDIIDDIVKVKKPMDCTAAKSNGIYNVQIDQYSPQPFAVPCDTETEDGEWLVIQRRQNGTVDFYRNWLEYEQGFGDIEGEFFIGLKKLYALTNFNGPQELLITMEDQNGVKAFAKYDEFAIGNETEAYELKTLGKYSGTAGDALEIHLGMKFSTKDRDNDIHESVSCAQVYTGAWWYRQCHKSNLNGKYGDNTKGKGIVWHKFRGNRHSLPYVQMMIRPSKNL